MNYLQTYESYFTSMDYGFHHVDDKLPKSLNDICLIKYEEDSKVFVSKWNGQFKILEDEHPNGNTPSYYPTNPTYWKSCWDIKSEVDEYMFTLTDELQSYNSDDSIYSEDNKSFRMFYDNIIITEDKKKYVLGYLLRLEKVLMKEFGIKEIRFNIKSTVYPTSFYKFSLDFDELSFYILRVYKDQDIILGIHIKFLVQ